MTDFQDRIARLPVEKRAQLEQLLRARALAAERSTPIPRRQSQEPAPLSFSQQRLWFLAQLYPGQTTYNEASAYRFQGLLDVKALRAALNGLVQRHEILRTTYHSYGGEPVQVIQEPREVPVPIVDLTGFAEGERIAEAQRRFAATIEEPFDLTSDLVLRGCLYRLDSNDHILLAVRHHIASDGWSSRLFWNEVKELYAAETTGRPARLPSLPLQYADYATWQRDWLKGERLERQLGYWRAQLADLPLLQLPTDRRRPERLSFYGAGERFSLDPALVETLRALARQESTTLHTLLMAAYAVLLSRTAAQDDVPVGVPVAGRIRKELEPLIGFFVNTLVVRAQFGENPSFRVLLREMKQTTLAALDHQAIPFEKLVEVLEPERHLNRSPLISTTFQLLELPQVSFDLPQLVVESIDVPNLHAKFDMECALVARPGGVSGHWRYALDLFDSATIQRMIGRYQTLLAAIAQNPDSTTGQLPMMTKEEQRQVLYDWTAAPPALPLPASLVHELFEAQARRAPEAAAVADKDRQLTYAELDHRANQVANRLRELGIGPETAVGLYLDRTVEMVVGLLGILKAGGAFVPLDPAAPSARLLMLAEDARLRLVLTTTRHLSGWPATSIPVECLDTGQWASYEVGPRPESAAREDSAAYILYTSGSTGRPKGVVVEHRQLLSYVCAAVEQYGMAQGGVFVMLQSLTVDSCQTMIFPALGWGGTLHLVSRERSLDAGALSTYFQRHRPDFLKIAPSHLQALMAGTDPECLLPRCALIIGGEVFHWGLAEQLLALQPECAIWNHYGPTETTVGVLTYPLTEKGTTHRAATASVPLGRPLPGVRICILDRYGNPAPIGVRGDLCVGGPLVARGYLNHPDPMASQFSTDVPGGELAGRYYRTGDLARRLHDGVVEFLGRDDGQVKIRGFRLELGEIEAALGAYPGVAERCVLLRTDEPQRLELVAYLSPRPDARLSVQEVDAFLRSRLPEVMVPAAYVVLDALPRTAHGKIDRAALQPPDLKARVSREPGIAPRSPEEVIVASIWSEVFGLDRVGIHDNFFDLGGHSLLAIRVIARITRVWGVEVPVRTLFEKPTVAEIASEVKNLTAGLASHRQEIETVLAEVSNLSPEELAALLRTKRAASQLGASDGRQVAGGTG